MIVARCFQWIKDTNLKANHNYVAVPSPVSDRCFQWIKDTNLKANHNRAPTGEKRLEDVSNGSKILI